MLKLILGKHTGTTLPVTPPSSWTNGSAAGSSIFWPADHNQPWLVISFTIFVNNGTSQGYVQFPSFQITPPWWLDHEQWQDGVQEGNLVIWCWKNNIPLTANNEGANHRLHEPCWSTCPIQHQSCQSGNGRGLQVPWCKYYQQCREPTTLKWQSKRHTNNCTSSGVWGNMPYLQYLL